MKADDEVDDGDSMAAYDSGKAYFPKGPIHTASFPSF